MFTRPPDGRNLMQRFVGCLLFSVDPCDNKCEQMGMSWGLGDGRRSTHTYTHTGQTFSLVFILNEKYSFKYILSQFVEQAPCCPPDCFFPGFVIFIDFYSLPQDVETSDPVA